jgi:hypothetical protein
VGFGLVPFWVSNLSAGGRRAGVFHSVPSILDRLGPSGLLIAIELEIALIHDHCAGIH